MNKGLYRERSLLKFQRYYMHGIRNGFEPQKASSDAMFKVRQEINADLKDDLSFENDIEREEVYSQCLEMILIFKMALEKIPIDMKKMDEIRRLRKEEEVEVGSQIGEGASEVLAAAVTTGLETLTKKQGKEKDASRP